MNLNPTGLGLAVLRRVAANPWLQRSGLGPHFDRLIYHGSRAGFAAATAGNRAFKAARSLSTPGRPPGIDPAGVFDLTPTDDQAMLREAAARFAGERLRRAAADADEACAAPADLLDAAAGLGLASLSVPEAMDGAGAEHSAVTGALIAEALAHGDMGLALACLAPVSAANALLRWGTGAQQAAYLAPFAGEHPPAAAIAVAEDRPLFDPLSPATTAERRGDRIVLNGRKVLVPRAADAEFFMVAAGEADGGVGVYIVERSAGGLSVDPAPGMGVRGAGTGNVVLTDTTIPVGNRLGGDDGCDYPALLALSRLAWCALAAGTGQAVLDYVTDYANDRQAFGEPISHRQGVAFAIADMAIELEGLRLAAWRAAALADAGKPFAKQAAIAHRLASRHGMAIGSWGVQLLGGHGFVKEHPVERWYRDLRAVGVLTGAVCL